MLSRVGMKRLIIGNSMGGAEYYSGSTRKPEQFSDVLQVDASGPDWAGLAPRMLYGQTRVALAQSVSGEVTQRSTVWLSPSRTRLENHQSAPFLIVQSASVPDSNSAAIRPRVG